MSRTLKLVDELFAHSQHLEQLGRTHDAEHLLERLASFRRLRPQMAGKTQAKLGELHLVRGEFVRARQHLRDALRHLPFNADLHFMLAEALNAGQDADASKAVEHYRRALAEEPDQPDCLAACGMALVQLGQTEEGVNLLRRAWELAPDDLEILEEVATGLRQANRTEEARGLLLAARFRNGRDPRFQKFWSDSQFQAIRTNQQRAKAEEIAAELAPAKPVILPFPRSSSKPKATRQVKKKIRHDSAEKSPAPLRILPEIRADERHAQ